MALIILEGPDASGKSTLAKALNKQLTRGTTKVVHSGPPVTSHLLEEYMLPLVDYKPRHDMHIVLDRWHLGEFVYPEIHGRETLITRETLAYLELFLMSRGAVLVQVNADPLALRNRRAARGEDTLDITEIHQEMSLFFQAAAHSRLPFVFAQTSGWDTEATPEKWAETILKHAFYEEMVASRLAKYTTYVGPRNPNVLIIGDQRGQTDPRYPTAFAPLPNTSGLYLLKSLPSAVLSSASIGFVNANEGDNVAELWEDLGRPHAVALGHMAISGTLRAGLTEFGRVPHPQYIRRFHHDRASDYGRLIMDVAESKEDKTKWPQ